MNTPPRYLQKSLWRIRTHGPENECDVKQSSCHSSKAFFLCCELKIENGDFNVETRSIITRTLVSVFLTGIANSLFGERHFVNLRCKIGNYG